MLPGAPFDCVKTQLRPGDTLLMYSDGLTECEDSWGDMLEVEGLTSLLAQAAQTPREAIDDIQAGVQAHAGIAGFEDDVSMLVFNFGGLASAQAGLAQQSSAADAA
jgi:sigma-B regulation protein RsbU (phosphoserine phosphatase)